MKENLSFKDFDVYTEEVAQAVKENRVMKVGDKWRVFFKNIEVEEAPAKKAGRPKKQ